MKRFIPFITAVILTGLAVVSGQAAFSSLYSFGDGVSCTANDNSGAPALYYGNRLCNGRIWLEVLAERQGMAFDPNKNHSFWGHYSSALLTNVSAFSAADASNSLFVVWVCNADFVQAVFTVDPPYTSASLPAWTGLLNLSLTNHFAAIQNLYSKGARTLMMPNAVDLTKVPYYGMSPPDAAFVRQRVLDYNVGLTSIVAQAKASLPGLEIYVPDFFANLDNLLAHPANYGLVNPGIDAVSNPALPDKSLNGPGAYYVFWDEEDPTAKVHEIMTEIAQQLVSPVSISKITRLTATNKLDLANVPVGLNGLVELSTNLVNWTTGTAITSTNASQSVLVPTAGARQFHRLRFPYTWAWP